MCGAGASGGLASGFGGGGAGGGLASGFGGGGAGQAVPARPGGVFHHEAAHGFLGSVRMIRVTLAYDKVT